jgi:O-antigen ligase
MVPNARRHAPATTSVLITGGLLLAVPLAMRSVLFAIAIAGVLVIAILVGWLGLERTSVVLMVLAFALAPADTLAVSFLGVSDVLFFLAMGLAIPRLLRTRLTLPTAFIVASLAFITFGLLSSVAADDTAVYYYTARVMFTFVFLPAMVVWWAPRGKVLVWLLVAYAVGTGVSVAYGIPKIGAYRNYGLTQHPNVLGYTAVLTMALVPFLYVALSPKWRLRICGSVLAVVGVGIFTSGSRAALVVAVVLVVLVPAVERSIPLALTVATAGVIAVGVIGERAAPAEGQDALSRLLGAGDVSQSDQARVEGVDKTWDVALNHPWLGTGFDFSDFIGHNVYVQVAAAIGFFGLAAFVVILLSMVTALFATSNIHSRLVYPAIVFILAGPVSPQLTDRYIGLLLGIALVGVNAVKAERQDAEEPEPPLHLNRKNSSSNEMRSRSSPVWNTGRWSTSS